MKSSGRPVFVSKQVPTLTATFCYFFHPKWFDLSQFTRMQQRIEQRPTRASGNGTTWSKLWHSIRVGLLDSRSLSSVEQNSLLKFVSELPPRCANIFCSVEAIEVLNILKLRRVNHEVDRNTFGITSLQCKTADSEFWSWFTAIRLAQSSKNTLRIVRMMLPIYAPHLHYVLWPRFTRIWFSRSQLGERCLTNPYCLFSEVLFPSEFSRVILINRSKWSRKRPEITPFVFYFVGIVVGSNLVGPEILLERSPRSEIPPYNWVQERSRTEVCS